MADEWSPPKRNTEDPDRPPIPGLERSAPRIHPGSRLYHQAGNTEVWGHLAHPSLQQHNPFLNGVEHAEDEYDFFRPAKTWKAEEGGRDTAYRDKDYPPAQNQEAAERQIRRNIGTAHPAIAISRNNLLHVLHSGRVKSQFETHTSGGLLDFDERGDVERQMFGYPKDLPAHARPIYGYLTHRPLASHPGASVYGDHALILHRPRVAHRTSAFMGDTLDEQNSGHSAHPMQDFKLSGVPTWIEPKHHDLDRSENDVRYAEAHIHGGVGLRDIHYAVLHPPTGWTGGSEETVRKHQQLKDTLDRHGVPWVEASEHGRALDWRKHEARVRRDIMKGAIMQPEHRMSVTHQQGPGRYLIDLGYEDDNGHRQAQIADTETGTLHPPMSKDSILARGYWERPDVPVEAADLLPRVTPR